jgi:hypothetical protein
MQNTNAKDKQAGKQVFLFFPKITRGRGCLLDAAPVFVLFMWLLLLPPPPPP